MDRYVIAQHLAQARRHLAAGEMHLARQHEIIAELERDGHDANEAKKLLAQFIVMHCRRLEREFENIESGATPSRPQEISA